MKKIILTISSLCMIYLLCLPGSFGIYAGADSMA